MAQVRNQRPAAFVLDLSTNGLGIARSLGREGIEVVGVDFDPISAGRVSKYCRCIVPSKPPDEPEQLLNVLVEVGRKYLEKGVLYPGSDDDVLFISRFRRPLSEYFRFSVPPNDLVESLMNKRRQYGLAQEVGIPYAETHYPVTFEDVERIKNQIEYPSFVKPYYSHLWSEVYKTKGFVVNSPRELVETYQAVFAAHLEAMVQSIIPGPDSNIVEVYAYLTEDHEVLGSFVTRKLRQHPNDFGVGTCLVSFHDPKVLEIGVKFFQRINYVGLGSIEFKKDDVDGQYKLLELNVRLAHHNMQATCAGVNFPLIQYMDLTGQRVKKMRDYKDMVVWIDDLYDFLAFYELNRNGKLSFTEWIRSVLTADCHSYFAWDDVRPFVKDLSREFRLFPRRYIERRR